MSGYETQTPVQIDTALAGLYYESQKLGQAAAAAVDSIHRAAGDEKSYRYGRGNATWKKTTENALALAEEFAADQDATYYVREAAERAVKAYGEAKEALAENHAAQRTIGAEFRRRGGWTRAFLVNNGDGHVHSSMNCSTCNRGQYATSFQWMTEYSDHAETEIVAAAGWRACTICYPSAPVGDEKSLPTKMFSTEDISKAERKAEAAKAKEAREAKKKASAPTLSGEPLKVHIETVVPTHGPRAGIPQERFETFQTERSAMIWATDQVAYRHYGWSRNSESALVTSGIRVVAQAIADKRGVEVAKVLAEIETKGKKKAAKG